MQLTVMHDPNGSTYATGYLSNVRIIKGTALYTANFTPSTSPLTVVANTVLLTCQSTQTVTYDANTTPNSITVSGGPRPTKSIPFSLSYAGQFNGSTAYLSIPSKTALNLSSNNFTIECWIYPTSFTNGNGTILSNNIASYSSGAVILKSNHAGKIGFGAYDFSSVGTDLVSYSNTGLSNTWTHVALVRSGTTFTLYVNGISQSTATSSITVNFSTVNTLIGYDGAYDGSSSYYAGYISNLHILNGTALYTTNFSPSNTPLTAIANTVLLTLQSGSISNTFIDNSNNAFTITANGTPSANVVSMATPGYSPMPSIIDTSTAATTYGGSYYFNGTTDYIQATVTAPGTGNFTIEGWVYAQGTGASATPNIFSIVASGSSNGFQVYISPATYGFGVRNNTQNILGPNTGSVVAVVNTWYHVALVRNSGTITLYINGTSIGTTSTAYTFSDTQFNAGYSPVGNYLNGYVSNIRYVNGQALYTTNFTPPTAPLNPLLSTALLLSGTNSSVYDSTMQNDFVNIGGVSVNSNVKQYGTNSYYFNGSSGYLLSPATPQLTLGTGNFTLEYWLYLNSTSQQGIFGTRPQSTNGIYPVMYFLSGTLRYNVNSTDVISASISSSTWYHIAVSRSGSSTKMFINGTQAGSTYTDNNNYLCSRLVIGADDYVLGNTPLNGYIQDLRVTNGVARYTSNFTVPSTTFITQ
jgi:hypothetical protein